MPRLPSLDIVGPVAFHDQACAVYPNRKAVYNLNRGVFEPCWEAQDNGWRLVRVDSWLQRMVMRLAFGVSVKP
jgi:hypothetical protein